MDIKKLIKKPLVSAFAAVVLTATASGFVVEAGLAQEDKGCVADTSASVAKRIVSPLLNRGSVPCAPGYKAA